MKQKKYLGKRIFALCLALLLSLNTATAYASGDMPAASESSKTVSETSDTFVEEESFESTETDETETPDGSGEITVEKPAGGSEETDPAKGDDGGVTSTGATVTIIYVDAEGNEFSEAPVDAGTYTAKIKAELAGYDNAECEATVTIEKRKLTVNTASDSKTYDGTPLTNSTAVVMVENGAVAGEEITATATGSRTEVGSAVNTYTLNWGNAKAGNYEITEVLGTLTVHAADVG